LVEKSNERDDEIENEIQCKVARYNYKKSNKEDSVKDEI
jgi:hypothetical protein